ncbi:MAG: HDOD domain-containing protein [Synergistaceae bacterium]|nr:HDOD domain-containing protein [Synergistaceae bacterium]
MKNVSVTQLKSGMILSGDLIAPNGRFILPRGACLTAKSIMSLKIWGIAEVPVAVAPGPESLGGELLFGSKVTEEAREMLLDTFCGIEPSTPFMMEIFRLGVNETARGLASGKSTTLQQAFSLELPFTSTDREEKPTLTEIVETEANLATFPDVYFRICEALQSPKSSITHIADLISKDTSLSTTLLKIANSGIYGVPYRIESIPRAAALIGGRALSVLALGISAVEVFNHIPVEWVNMKSFWRHSVGVAVLAQILASLKNAGIIEKIFVAGILHDMGRLVLFRHLPFTMARVMKTAAERKIPLVEAEREELGFDHAELGGCLVEKWCFPRSLSQLVKNHHNATEGINSYPAAILSTADVLATATGLGNGGSWHVRPLPDGVERILDIAPSALEMIVRQATRQTTEIYSLFRGGDDIHGKTVSHA